MSKELPILDADGRLRDRVGIWVLCYMAFPESETDAVHAAECLFDDADGIEAGWLEGFGEVSQEIQKLISRRVTRFRLAGQVFHQMLVNVEQRGTPDFRKATFAVSEISSRTKNQNGKPLPSDGDNLRKEFRKMRSASYFWGAFDLLPVEVQAGVLSASPGELPSLAKLCLAASELQARSEATEVFSKVEALKGIEPWVVPRDLTDRIRREISVEFPGEPESVQGTLDEYVNKPFGHS